MTQTQTETKKAKRCLLMKVMLVLEKSLIADYETYEGSSIATMKKPDITGDIERETRRTE